MSFSVSFYKLKYQMELIFSKAINQNPNPNAGGSDAQGGTQSQGNQRTNNGSTPNGQNTPHTGGSDGQARGHSRGDQHRKGRGGSHAKGLTVGSQSTGDSSSVNLNSSQGSSVCSSSLKFVHIKYIFII